MCDPPIATYTFTYIVKLTRFVATQAFYFTFALQPRGGVCRWNKFLTLAKKADTKRSVKMLECCNTMHVPRNRGGFKLCRLDADVSNSSECFAEVQWRRDQVNIVINSLPPDLQMCVEVSKQL